MIGNALTGRIFEPTQTKQRDQGMVKTVCRNKIAKKKTKKKLN
jgi:hypothetical protein